MKRAIKTILLLVFLVSIGVFLAGCKQAVQLDQGWSSPVRVTDTRDADAGGGFLYKWRDKIILLKDRYDRSAKSSTCSIIVRNNDSSNSWSQLPPLSVLGVSAFYCPTFDEAKDRIIFEQGHIENDQLLMSVIFVRMSERVEFKLRLKENGQWIRNHSLG